MSTIDYLKETLRTSRLVTGIARFAYSILLTLAALALIVGGTAAVLIMVVVISGFIIRICFPELKEYRS